ncbi:MAG: PaaI family thioesterase [Pseudomonadota bacterium]
MGINPDEFIALVEEGLPQTQGARLKAEDWQPGSIRLVMPIDHRHGRPGGTVAGPTLFALADLALYGAVLSRIGRVELAVTTSMTINFLRKPALTDVAAEAKLLKLGKRLAYGEVHLYSIGTDDPIAHVTGTYSIPPKDPMR